MFRGPKNKTDNLWTEITKDLVIPEAIEQMGYDYEETEFFYYVIQYLRYVSFLLPPSSLCIPVLNPLKEDVEELVRLSESIRRERKERIKEIQRERERMERREKEGGRKEKEGEEYEERIIEREIIYDGRGPPRRSGRW